MLFSLSLIFLCGIILGTLFKFLKLPQLLGMLITGILLGPFCLNLIDNKVLNISSELRQIALIIILFRAGLNLNITQLKSIGKNAIFMCFIPATFEILGMSLLAPILLNISLLDSIILGTVIAAVSPAVIVPQMLYLIENNYGNKKNIPQLIMAGASVDDIYVIVLFTSFLAIKTTGNFSIISLFKIPISIILGIFIGFVLAFLLIKFFKKFHIRDSIKVLLLLSLSFILITLENKNKSIINFSSLLSIMSIGIFINQKYFQLSKRLSIKFSKIWLIAEILLFVLVGASLNISYVLNSGFNVILLIIIVLIFRSFGVFVSLLGTNFTKKEKLFCVFAFLPKATVQAAIGSIPLSLGIASGNIILTVSILSILITAPIGSLLIDLTYKKFLK